MNTIEDTVNRKGQRIVIKVAKKPHTGNVLNTAALSRNGAGPKADDEATRHALAVLESLCRFFGGSEAPSRRSPTGPQ